MTQQIGADLYSSTITRHDDRLFNSSAERVKIDRIIIHHNATTNKDVAINTWLEAGAARTSAHYEITPEEIIGCVGENFTAWHAGDWAMNLRSIGLEHVNATGTPDWTVADATLRRSAALIADICHRYGFPPDRAHILPHQSVVATACPGGLNLDKLISYAQAAYQGESQPKAVASSRPAASPQTLSLEELAGAVIAGKYGNGAARAQALGSYATAVQTIVNERLKALSADASHQALAREVLAGRLGNGAARKQLLGSYYQAVQDLVNRGFK